MNTEKQFVGHDLENKRRLWLSIDSSSKASQSKESENQFKDIGFATFAHTQRKRIVLSVFC